jgi:hypothetical protein
MLKRVEEYFQASIPSLEWEDLDQLELVVENIIRPQRGRPRILENDETSRNETSPFMKGIHSSVSAPQRAENPAAKREMLDPAARQPRRPKSKNTRPGQRRGDPMTEASVVPSLGRCPHIPSTPIPSANL